MSEVGRPTARDVAARAGVSVATVSYVVNGRNGRCTAQTRERVLAAARELGYAPNSSARGLRRRRTERLCLVVGSIGVPAYDQLARDLHSAAAGRGYAVITLVVDSATRAEQAFDLLQQSIADGAVVNAPSRYLDQIRLSTLARNGLALVVMDNAVAAEGFDVVRTPERQACGEALDHLLASGRRRVAFVGHRHDFDPPGERLLAYLDALARFGIARDDRLLAAGADDRVGGYRATAALLDADPRPDAVFAASDRAAVSAIWAARDRGLAVPGDVAVLGVGNLEDGLVTKPALSTIGQPQLDYSEVAGLLLDRLAAPDRPPPPRRLVLPWSFIRRGST